jgi:BirA family biotin operon repressor/biotin-[acetyl-CoA-carboxylase] ligase
MDINSWKARLEELPLGELFIYQELSSTNQVAEDLIIQGAPNLSLILADSQTAGKGRAGRSWITVPGKALAFSLILYPDPAFVKADQIEKLSGLGSLAVAEALKENLGLNPEIKWPNDVLISRKKVSGVLVDINWTAGDIKSIVIGIGLNVSEGSVPDQELNFPGASIEEFTKLPVNRLDLLVDIIQSLLKWYSKIPTQTFMAAWEGYLAFKKEQVALVSENQIIDQGCLEGLSADGSLVIRRDSGELREYRTGEIQLRLVDRS